MKARALSILLSLIMVLGCAFYVYAEEPFEIVQEEQASEDFIVDSGDEIAEDLDIAEEMEEFETVAPAEAEAAPIISAATAITSVSLKNSSMVYTGKARTQTSGIVVKANTKTLKNGTDYTVSYKNNVNVGTATVIVKGKGKYTGTIKKTFKITAVALASASLKNSSMVYTGKARTQTSGIVVKAKVNGTTKTLTKSTDYTVSYANNINVGTATVTIKGKGNYKGTIKKTFKITAVALASATLKNSSMGYTGKARKQDSGVTVKAKVNGTAVTLTKDTDYTLSYANNIDVGTATVTIKGKGNFKGTIKKTFKITALNISKTDIAFESGETEYEYTGEAIEPAVVIRNRTTGDVLVENTDYTISYADNIKVGTATITIQGMGNYTGSTPLTFTIYKAPSGEFVDPVTQWSVYDDLINQIRKETDKAKRTELMHQAEDILMATNAVIPLYYYNDLYMMKDYVSGVYSNVYGIKYLMYAAMNNGSDTLRVSLASEPVAWDQDYENSYSSIDPALNSTVDGACLIANAFSGLYTYNENGQTVPACAAGYEVSADGLTYTVTLKSGLKWSDGTALTAEDFEYSWKRAAAPETAADYGYMFEAFDGYDAGNINVAALDDTTLQFVLTAPCAYMEDLMAFQTFVPVPKAYVEAHSTAEKPGAWSSDPGFPSNGAFKLTQWAHESSMTFEKNPYFWDAENVSLEKLEYMLTSSDTQMYDAYQAGNVDLIDAIPVDAVSALIESGSPELLSANELGTYYLAFNVKSPLFDGMTAEQAAAVREAVNILIDREYIIKSITMGGQLPASTFIPAGMSDGNGGIFHADINDGYYDPYAISIDYKGTLARAAELLKSAGFKFDASGMLSNETPLSIEYLTNAGTAHTAIAEAVQADLSAVGIAGTVTVVDWSAYTAAQKEGNFDMTRGGWVADINDPINMLELFTSDSANNIARFGK